MKDFDETTCLLLEKLEKTHKEFWNIPKRTANFINMLIKMNNVKNALEIGTSNGYSAIWIGKALKKTGGRLTTIEYYEKRIDVAKYNLKIAQVDDIINIIQGRAIDIINSLEEKFDFVFIDANKSEYIEYFNIIKNKLEKKAIILADNVNSHREKVQNFLDVIGKDKNFQSEIIDFEGGLLIAIKI